MDNNPKWRLSMKQIARPVLASSFVGMFAVAVMEALQPSALHLTALATHPLTSTTAASFVGGGIWGQIGCGLACGAGIVGIAAGGLSGVGVPAAIIAVSGVAGCCIGAFDA